MSLDLRRAVAATGPAQLAAAPSVSALASRLGRLDAGRFAGWRGWFREGDNVRALHARASGRRTRLVGLTWIDVPQAVVALPGAGIARPEQLAGRRLGLPRREGVATVDVARAAASRGLHAATDLACLFGDEYALVDLPVPAAGDAARPQATELAALARGEVDAVYVAGAAGRAAAERVGAVAVVDLGAHLHPLTRVNATTPAALTVEAAALERDPDRVVALLETLLRAGAWAERHPDAVAQLLGSPGLEGQLHVDLSERKRDALAAQRDFLLAHGFLAADVDLDAWIDPAPLAAARERLAREAAA